MICLVHSYFVDHVIFNSFDVKLFPLEEHEGSVKFILFSIVEIFKNTVSSSFLPSSWNRRTVKCHFVKSQTWTHEYAG